MKYSDQTFDPEIKKLSSYELYTSIHHSLLNKGHRMNNGLQDLLEALTEWMDKNTNQIGIRKIIPNLGNKINKEDAIGLSKSFLIHKIAEHLMEKDFFEVVHKNNQIEVTFNALLVNKLGKRIRIPLMPEPVYFYEKDLE